MDKVIANDPSQGSGKSRLMYVEAGALHDPSGRVQMTPASSIVEPVLEACDTARLRIEDSLPIANDVSTANRAEPVHAHRLAFARAYKAVIQMEVTLQRRLGSFTDPSARNMCFANLTPEQNAAALSLWHLAEQVVAWFRAKEVTERIPEFPNDLLQQFARGIEVLRRSLEAGMARRPHSSQIFTGPGTPIKPVYKPLIRPYIISREAAPEEPAQGSAIRLGCAYERLCVEEAAHRGGGCSAVEVARERGEAFVRNHPFPGLNVLSSRSGCHHSVMTKAIEGSEMLKRAKAAYDLKRPSTAQRDGSHKSYTVDEALRILIECALETERAEMNTPEFREHLEGMRAKALSLLVEDAREQFEGRRRAVARARARTS